MCLCLIALLTIAVDSASAVDAETRSAASGATAVAAPSAETPAPPVARAIPQADTTHGDVRVDDYAWLRNREDPEVIAYLEAENAYTDAVMGHTEALQETLYEEIIGRIKQTDLTVPYPDDGYFYYWRSEEGKQYQIFCRKKGSLEAEEEVLLDENALAEGHDYFDVGTASVSPDHTMLAYNVDTTGAEHFTLYVLDLESGQLLPDVIEDVDYDIVWANDNETIFYVTSDEMERTDKLWRHELGSDRAEDTLVFHEPDDSYWVGVYRTRSDQYILLQLWKRTSGETWLLSADDPAGEFRVVEPRAQDVEYDVSHRGDYFYIRTNAGGKNFEVVRAPVESPSRDNWVSVIPHRDDVKVDRVYCFRDYLVVGERERGLQQLRVVDLKDGSEHRVTFPEPTYSIWPAHNEEFDTDSVRFNYSSLVTPRSVYDYNMETRERTLLKQTEVLGGYDPSLYRSERLYATARDGADVPISLVYREDTFQRSRSPLLLDGYGAYGSSSDPWFSSSRLTLLDRGVVYAIAHVRGGGEMGEEWYEQGKMLQKKNTFTDFIACAEHLVAEGYADPGRVGMTGESAGGLLIGAVLNMRPDLFSLAVARVPFVDALNTMLDPTIPLTVAEYNEWGNPNDPEYYDYIKSYSPYDNVGPYDYPDILVMASLNDPRVQYWEPAKWVAKLRAVGRGDSRLILKVHMGAGHGGSSGRYDWYREVAFRYAFVLDCFGLVGGE
ncbi:MAG: prolyl oligopeptidase family serine peptidase [Candidatus Eisenbacteria bacterium]|nr:prolyl oligopeptidase family serine peptidase [Candidatus Eisenbacteria bacterium]